MSRGLRCVTTAVCFVSLAPPTAGDEAERARNDETLFTSRVLTITDVVLEQHIDPPARQQMILEGVKALYLADGRPVPAELSSRISELGGRDRIMEYLDGIRREFDDLDDPQAIMTHGLLAALPGMSFLVDAATSSVQEQVMNNRYVGTGIALSMNKEEALPQIVRVFYDGPAWKAGVKSGDLILEINGESTTSQELSRVTEALRGEAGSDVELVVRQPDSDELRALTVTRGRVFIPTVEGVREESNGKYVIDGASTVALLRCKHIGPSTLHELRTIAADLRRQGVRGIVLDLRGGGGILHDVVLVADGLLDGGIIGHVRSRDSSVTHEARSGALFQGVPLAVLVARNTSPGNVFLAAALQDNKRAIVVGEPTSGETYVSSIVRIPGRDDRLRLATAIMLRGDGTPLIRRRVSTLPVAQGLPLPAVHPEKPGFIVPDHIVHLMPNEQRYSAREESESDPILAKAVEVLSEAIARPSSSSTDGVSGS